MRPFAVSGLSRPTILTEPPRLQPVEGLRLLMAETGCLPARADESIFAISSVVQVDGVLRWHMQLG